MNHLGKRIVCAAFMVVAAPILWAALAAFSALLMLALPIWAFVRYEQVWEDLAGKRKTQHDPEAVQTRDATNRTDP